MERIDQIHLQEIPKRHRSGRGIYNTLLFKLPVNLIFFCVMGLNMVFGVNDHSAASPWEKYNGRKVSLKNNLKASFGDFVQAARNKIDNTLSTRTDGCLALYDTGNLEGMWWLYNVSTDKLSRRNRFEILPMADVVIQHLNNMADRSSEDHDLKCNLVKN